MASEMEREGFTHPAPDRRGHDLAGPHGGQDRAALQRSDRPRARRVARRGRGGQPAERHPARRLRGRTCATSTATCASSGAGRAPEERRQPLADARRNRLADRLDRRRAARALLDRPHGARRLPARGPGAADRLDAVLPDLGAGRPLPGHPDRSVASAPAATSLFRDAQALLDRIVRERLLRARGVFGVFRANAVGDDIELYADEDAHRAARGHPHAPPADDQAARPAQPRAGRLRGAAGVGRGRLRGRVRRHGRRRARRAGGRVRGGSTTTTTRSWPRRWPTGWRRRSPSGCTSGCAGSTGPTRRTKSLDNAAI